MTDCLFNYKVIRDNVLVGAVQLEYMGRDCMCIKYITTIDPEIHIPLYQQLRIKHPESIIWSIRNRPNEPVNPEFDFEEKRQRFWEDNSFEFHTGHGHFNYSNWRLIKQYIPSTQNLIQHCTLDKLTYRAVGIPDTDIYDANLSKCRITDTNFCDSIIYDTGLNRIQIIASGINDGKFFYVDFEGSVIKNSSLVNVSIENCDIKDFTIDGINVKEALYYYMNREC